MQEFIKKPASKHSLSVRSNLYGVGINDAWYAVNSTIDGKRARSPSYSTWKSMLMRCYSEKYQSKQPTYKGCSVCKEWLLFSNFDEWYDCNCEKYSELDKDIKVKGCKEYSPDTCLLVPKSINYLLLDCAAAKGNLPTGVSLSSKGSKYNAKVRIDSTRVHIGVFATPEEAGIAYVKAKNAEIMRKCEQYPEFAQYLINHLLTGLTR